MGKKNKNKNNKSKIPRGFVSLRGFGNQQTASEFRRLSYPVNGTASAGGIYAILINAALMRANSTEWASYAARFTEYRIIRTKVHMGTAVASTISVVSNADCICAVDRSGALSTPTTVSQIWATAGARVFNLDTTTPKLSSFSAEADDLEDQNFTAVTTNSTTYAIQLLATGTASIPLVSLYIEWMVEFRGAQ